MNYAIYSETNFSFNFRPAIRAISLRLHFFQRLRANNANFPHTNDGFDAIVSHSIILKTWWWRRSPMSVDWEGRSDIGKVSSMYYPISLHPHPCTPQHNLFPNPIQHWHYHKFIKYLLGCQQQHCSFRDYFHSGGGDPSGLEVGYDTMIKNIVWILSYYQSLFVDLPCPPQLAFSAPCDFYL